MSPPQSLIAGTLMLIASAGLASDLAKEKRWADQIVDELIDADTLCLVATLQSRAWSA